MAELKKTKMKKIAQSGCSKFIFYTKLAKITISIVKIFV